MTTTLQPPEPLRPLDLAQEKGVGALMTSAWRIWRARPGLFLRPSLIIGVPLLSIASITSEVIVRGPAADRLDAFSQTGELAPGDARAFLIAGAVLMGLTLFSSVLVSAFTVAIQSRALLSLACGDDVTSAEAWRLARERFGAVVGVSLLWSMLTLVGMAAFVLPGLWILLAGMFGPLLAALSTHRGWGAVRESIRVVHAVGWWRTLGAFVVVNLVVYAVLMIPSTVLSSVSSVSDSLLAAVASGLIQAVIQAVLLSWSALATALVFFSWKCRAGEPWERPSGTVPVEIPGGGGPPVAVGMPAAAAMPGASSAPRFVRPSAASRSPASLQSNDDEHFFPGGR